jgi:hypothetical protein
MLLRNFSAYFPTQTTSQPRGLAISYSNLLACCSRDVYGTKISNCNESMIIRPSQENREVFTTIHPRQTVPLIRRTSRAQTAAAFKVRTFAIKKYLNCNLESVIIYWKNKGFICSNGSNTKIRHNLKNTFLYSTVAKLYTRTIISGTVSFFQSNLAYELQDVFAYSGEVWYLTVQQIVELSVQCCWIRSQGPHFSSWRGQRGLVI